MAIGVVIGVVFGNVVNSLVQDIIMPPLGFLLSGIDFSKLSLKLQLPGNLKPPIEMRYGAFINSVINFLIVSLVVFFIVKLMSVLRKSEIETYYHPRNCPECFMSIPARAKKCGYCCSILLEKHKNEF